jgi:hypothetical protein
VSFPPYTKLLPRDNCRVKHRRSVMARASVTIKLMVRSRIMLNTAQSERRFSHILQYKSNDKLLSPYLTTIGAPAPNSETLTTSCLQNLNLPRSIPGFLIILKILPHSSSHLVISQDLPACHGHSLGCHDGQIMRPICPSCIGEAWSVVVSAFGYGDAEDAVEGGAYIRNVACGSGCQFWEVWWVDWVGRGKSIRNR